MSRLVKRVTETFVLEEGEFGLPPEDVDEDEDESEGADDDDSGDDDEPPKKGRHRR